MDLRIVAAATVFLGAVCPIAGAGEAPASSYFRHDHGRAAADDAPLPAEFGSQDNLLWREAAEAGISVPSSVVYRGVMYMVKDGGIVTTLDASSGEMLKQFRAAGRGNYYASLVAGDGKVYLASESGVVTVLKVDAEEETPAAHDFGEWIMATPVIDRGTIYVRTAAALYAFGTR